MLTDAMHRQLVPTCFAGDIENIASIIQDNGTGPTGNARRFPPNVTIGSGAHSDLFTCGTIPRGGPFTCGGEARVQH